MRRPGSWDKRAADFPTSLFCNPYTLLYINAESGKSSALMGGVMIHIGQLIKQELEDQGRTVVWFAKRLSYSRTNVYKIFDRPTIDVDVLLRISTLLGVDFFKVYTEELENSKKK